MKKEEIRITVMISGSGTNLQAIIDAVEAGEIPRAKIVLVISNQASAYGLERAENHDIPTEIITDHDFADIKDREKAVIAALDNERTDLVVLAGYMKILPEAVIDAYEGRIINIHPALLPKFGGRGFYGLKVHQAVLDAGETETGVSIHYVTKEVDAGPIILQKKVEVRQSDTPEILAERVLEREHELYPQAIKKVIEEKGW